MSGHLEAVLSHIEEETRALLEQSGKIPGLPGDAARLLLDQVEDLADIPTTTPDAHARIERLRYMLRGVVSAQSEHDQTGSIPPNPAG